MFDFLSCACALDAQARPSAAIVTKSPIFMMEPPLPCRRYVKGVIKINPPAGAAQ
jgi:hypothetical protein